MVRADVLGLFLNLGRKFSDFYHEVVILRLKNPFYSFAERFFYFFLLIINGWYCILIVVLKGFFKGFLKRGYNHDSYKINTCQTFNSLVNEETSKMLVQRQI